MPRKKRFAGFSRKKGADARGRKTRPAPGPPTEEPVADEAIQHVTAEDSFVLTLSAPAEGPAAVLPAEEPVSGKSATPVVEDELVLQLPRLVTVGSAEMGASSVDNRTPPLPTAGTSESHPVVPPPSSVLGQFREGTQGVALGKRSTADLYVDPVPGCSFWQSPQTSHPKRSKDDLSDSDEEDEAARQTVLRQMRNVYNRPNFAAPARNEDVEMADEQAFVDIVPLPQIAFRAPDQDDLVALLADFEVDPDMEDGNDLEYVQQHAVVPVIAAQPQVEQPVDQRLSVQRRAAIAFERFHRHRRFYMAATERNVPAFHVGQMDRRCEHCGAKFFQAELNTRRQYSKCCRLGKFQLPPLEACPQLLEELFAGRHRLSGQFRRNVLIYNNCFQFASMQANLRTLRGRGPYVYAIQGRLLHHFAPNININEPERSRKGQRRFDPCNKITNILHQVNPYARQFRHLHEVYQSNWPGWKPTTRSCLKFTWI